MMDDNLKEILSKIYNQCGFTLTSFVVEEESREYDASRFQLNGWRIAYRSARTTPKKVGQFVTFWKRSENGPIEPLNEKDPIDFFVINVRSGNKFGQFVFPKSVLIENGILSTDKNEGKRAFRVYPGWDQTNNKQAEKSQKWQLNFFFEVVDSIDLEKVKKMFHFALENHMKSSCCCDIENIASQKTIEKGGFSSKHKLISFTK